MRRKAAGLRALQRGTLGLSLLLCGLPAWSALPQGIASQTGGPNDSLPLQIQADSGIEWQQNAHVYIARGNAVAIRGPSQVHADTLIAHYRDAKGTTTNTGGNTEIYRVEAEGHVTLQRDSQTVVGDRADYDVDQGVAVVTGKNLKMTTTTDIVTARDSLEWYDQKQIGVARGDAVAIRNGKTIKGDVLTAYMVKTAPATPGKPGTTSGGRPAPAKPKSPITPAAARAGKLGAAPGTGTAPGTAPAADSKISRVDAQGHVVIFNGLDTGHGDFGVYNADTGIATLINNVVIERGKDVIRGQRGVMDLNKNVSRMLPASGPGVAASAPQRVQGLFLRQEQPSQGGAPSGSKKP